MAEWLSKAEVSMSDRDYCHDGKVGEKSRLLATNRKLVPALAHRALRGSGTGGTNCTKIACSYPVPFGEAYSQVVTEVEPCWEGVPEGAQMRLWHGLPWVAGARAPHRPAQETWPEGRRHREIPTSASDRRWQQVEACLSR